MDHISLNSSSHNSHLVNSLDHFKSLNTFVDVTLVCEGHTVKAHKIILSAGSNVLHRLLVANPAKHPIIILAETKYDTLRMIVEFLYKGKIDIPRNDLKKLLAVATTFEMNELKKLCEENLNSKNVDIEPNSQPCSRTPDQTGSSPKKKRQRRQSSDSDILYDTTLMKREICDSPSGLEQSEVSPMADSFPTQIESAGFHPQIGETISLNKTSTEADLGGSCIQRKDASTECDLQPLKELKSNLVSRQPARPLPRLFPKPSYHEKSDDSESDAQNKFQTKRKRSAVWKYFTAINDSYAVCRICQGKFSYKTTVTNLNKHLKKKHWRFDPKNPPNLPEAPLIRIQGEELEEFEEIDFNAIEDEAIAEDGEQLQYGDIPSTSTPCILKIS